MNTGATRGLRNKDTDGEIARRRRVQLYRIAQRQRIRWNRDGRAAAESEDAVGSGYDSGSLRAQRDMGRADFYRLCPVSVRNPDPHAAASNARMDNFAHCLV